MNETEVIERFVDVSNSLVPFGLQVKMGRGCFGVWHTKEDKLVFSCMSVDGLCKFRDGFLFGYGMRQNSASEIGTLECNVGMRAERDGKSYRSVK